MSLPVDLQAAFIIALEVLQAHDVWAINSLKLFLKELNHPNAVEQILTALLDHLIAADPGTLFWLVEHHHHLAPEFSLQIFAQQRSLQYLEAQGYQQGHDFVSRQDQLYLTPIAQEALQLACAMHEYQFLEVLLDMRMEPFPNDLS